MVVVVIVVVVVVIVVAVVVKLNTSIGHISSTRYQPVRRQDNPYTSRCRLQRRLLSVVQCPPEPMLSP